MDFTTIYNKHYKELYRFSYRLTASDQDSKDLVHETFIKLHGSLNKRVLIKNHRSWLFKVLYNEASSIKKSRSNHRRIELKVTQKTINITNPDFEYDLQEKREIVISALNLLEERERVCLYLYNEGLKYKEIAETLSINEGSISNLISRSLVKLETILKREYNEMFE